MTAWHLLTLYFLLTAYGADLTPPLGDYSASASTNVSAYPTTQSTAKATTLDRTDIYRPVSAGRPQNYPQGDPPLATIPYPPPLFTDYSDVQSNPNLFTSHTDPTPPTRSSYDTPVLVDFLLLPPVSHGTDTSNMKDSLKRLMRYGQKQIWIIFAIKKDVPSNIILCGYGPGYFHTMTSTCTMPPSPHPPLSFCYELLYFITVFSISISLIVGTACAFGFAKCIDKLTGLKIPCSELLFIFLSLFPAPGMAAQSSIQIAVYTNANASTSVVAVDTVTSWAQLVTACAAPRANITLSPTFQMGMYTNEIDFR
jgi:hypothetical protein